MNTKQRMILTSTFGFFVLYVVDSSQGHFTISLVVSKSSHPTRVLTNQAYLENGLFKCVCAAPLSSNRLLHTQEDLMFHTEDKHHKPDPFANLH